MLSLRRLHKGTLPKRRDYSRVALPIWLPRYGRLLELHAPLKYSDTCWASYSVASLIGSFRERNVIVTRSGLYSINHTYGMSLRALGND